MELLNEIKSINDDSKWLFPAPYENKPVSGGSIDHAVRRSTFKDVARWSPHSLRRTAATHMTAMGISRLIVSKLLNHSDNSTTSIYDRHSYDAEKKHALEVWGVKLTEIINQSDETTNIIPIKTASN